MRIYEIIFSPTGGTKKTADILAGALAEELEVIDLTDRRKDFSYRFAEDDICLVAVPSFGGRVPVTAVERLGKMQGCGAQAVMLTVYGNRAIDDTMLELKDLLTEAGFRCVAGVSAVAEHSITREVAAGRPNAQDEAELKGFAEVIREKFGRADEPEIPGNRPYKTYGGGPLKPFAENCRNCGVCAKECPVDAIPVTDRSTTDPEKCISCMRCIAVCPWGLRRNDADKQAAIDTKLKTNCSVPKHNELFI